MGRGGRNKNKKGPHAAAAVAPVNDDEPPVGSETGADGDGIPPLPSVEAASGGEPTAGMGSEERRDSWPEREGEGEVEKLTVLNSVLVTKAMEEREQVSALASRVDEKSADAGALAGVERLVFQTAIKEPFLAAIEENAVLHARVAAVEKSVEVAEARAAKETDASGKAAALEAADVEKCQVLELLTAKDAKAEAASKNVAELEALVVDLAGKNTELIAERGELEKQLGEISVSANLVQAQKEEVEGSFKVFKENTEMYKQDMEEKLEDRLGELQVLRSRKVEMENKLHSVKAELILAVARNAQLESEVEASKIELAAARREVEKLRSEISEVGKKYNTVMAEVDRLRVEIGKTMTIKEEAVSALAAEKTKSSRELDAMNRKIGSIRANKDVALGMIHQKDAEATKLRAELERLRNSIAELRVLCDKHDANSSCLQDEKDTVMKALGEEKAERLKQWLRIGELESYNGEKDREIGVLKAELEDKKEKIDGLNGKLEQLQLAVAEAQQSEKSGVWTWLCPATTTVIAAASFAYAARSR